MCNRQININQLVAGHTLVFAADTVTHARIFSGQLLVARSLAAAPRFLAAAAQFNLLLPLVPAPVLASAAASNDGAGYEFPIARNSRHLTLMPDTHAAQRRPPLLVNGK